MRVRLILLGVALSAACLPGATAQRSRRVVACFGAGTGIGAINDRLPVPAENPANAGFIREANRMRTAMRTRAAFLYSPTLDNALADPDTDEVVLGQQLLNRAALQGLDVLYIGMGYVLAHEYAHAFQFRMVDKDLKKLGTTPQLELQADILSGYYGGARLKEQQAELGMGEGWYQSKQEVYLRAAESLGDFAFFSPDHHGTPSQRRAATRAGFIAGRDKLHGGIDEAFSLKDTDIFKWSREQADRVRR